MIKISWKWYTFDELSKQTLYAILKLRQEVFVVEQECVYLDCDGLDVNCLHLVGFLQTDEQPELVAYLRVVCPQGENSLPAIGRLLTHQRVRGKGVGKLLTQKALNHLQTTYPGSAIRISAQLYLVEFYQSFGFQTSSESYDEDGIPHIEMMYRPV